jgi:hypothetical protein
LTIFEPMVILTNAIFCALCVLYFKKIYAFNHPYAKQMAWFILFMGVGSAFGAIAHAVHYQLGNLFFNTVFFIMNALSLFSIYCFFRAAFTYSKLEREQPKKYVYLVLAWILVLLALALIQGSFLLIKIHAALALLYSLVVHTQAYRKTKEEGSKLIVLGIYLSFLSIVVHSLKLSLHEWFNYKDISHVIMILSLLTLTKGILLNLQNLVQTKTHENWL